MILLLVVLGHAQIAEWIHRYPGEGSSGGQDIAVDSSGNEQWNSRYDSTGHTQDEAHAIVVDNAGFVYITGESIGTDQSNRR